MDFRLLTTVRISHLKSGDDLITLEFEVNVLTYWFFCKLVETLRAVHMYVDQIGEELHYAAGFCNALQCIGALISCHTYSALTAGCLTIK